MTEADDKIKEIKPKIEETLKELKNTLVIQPAITPPLIAHGKLLALTSEKLALTVEKLYKSSERLVSFTVIPIIVTVFLALIPIIELLKDFLPTSTLVI